MDAIGKHVFYEQALNHDNIIEELGDMEFYMQALRVSLAIKRKQTTNHNIEKLQKRYPNLQFSNKDAKERKDKQCKIKAPGFATLKQS